MSKYCLRDVKGKKKRRVEPVVLSTDSLSVVLERKEGNGWKADLTRKEVCTNCTLIKIDIPFELDT